MKNNLITEGTEKMLKRTIFTFKEKGRPIVKRNYPSDEDLNIRTSEEIRVRAIYYAFVEMETEPTEQQIEEVEEALKIMRFISDITYRIDRYISKEFKYLIEEKVISPITKDVKIFALGQMIDYLSIRRNLLKEGKKSRSGQKNKPSKP